LENQIDCTFIAFIFKNYFFFVIESTGGIEIVEVIPVLMIRIQSILLKCSFANHKLTFNIDIGSDKSFCFFLGR